MSMQVLASRWSAMGALLAAALATSCFYDSRWGEPKRAQAAAAQRATPKGLRPTEGRAGPAEPLRVMRVRALATARYAAEVMDWQRQLKALVDDANLLLGPTLNVRLEVAEGNFWPAKTDDQDLSGLLAELEASDEGEGCDWVVGLAGSLPRAEMSFHELGIARRSGKHLVMRAMNDAREYEVIRKELSEIAESERTRLYAVRKRHKSTTVLLHELAHTLGVLHQPDATAIMNPRYSIKAEQFSDAASEWMRAALKHREKAAEPGAPRFAEVELELLQRTADSWVPAERDQLMATLQATSAAASPRGAAAAAPGAAPASATPGSSSAAEAAGASSGAALAALSPAHQLVYKKAEAEEKAGNFEEAFDLLGPLIMRYPNVLAVQDMRCRLIMRFDAAWETVESECAEMVRLTNMPKKK